MSFLTDEDCTFLKEHGVDVEEAQRQLALLTNPPQHAVLDRPCTLGDGIVQLMPEERDNLIATHRDAADQGRWSKFVPASGAATRMFAIDSDDDKQRFCDSLEKFAFADLVRQQLTNRGLSPSDLLDEKRYDEFVDSVVNSDGLGYGTQPKGLIEFHRYADGTRTPFEEHLLESLDSLGSSDDVAVSHFTVGNDHKTRFAERLALFLQHLDSGTCKVSFSVQHPSTDAIAVDAKGDLLHTETGKPVLRPSGHGALIENLNQLRGDLVFVKNIDNVGHTDTTDLTAEWIQLLGGYLVRLQTAAHRLLDELETNGKQIDAAMLDYWDLANRGADVPTDIDREALIALLKRPLRVCGMVKNEGEPGGGPYWIRAADGAVTPQIVESAEIDKEDEQQLAIFQQASHFNPVFMALAVRDEKGEPYDLHQFIDNDRVIITQKQVAGQFVKAFERPGLWNGAMAKWNTVFVEVPKQVFSPVKTVFDLLRAEHQPLKE